MHYAVVNGISHARTFRNLDQIKMHYTTEAAQEIENNPSLDLPNNKLSFSFNCWIKLNLQGE